MITKRDLLEHASRFEFRYGSSWLDLIRVEKVLRSSAEDYWTIKWGGSRWSKSDKMFIDEPMGSNRSDDFIEDTKFNFEEAYNLASSTNLIKLHESRLKELGLI